MDIKSSHNAPPRKFRWPQDGVTRAALFVGLLSAYLMLVNLDYVALWHDEGHTAIAAQSLVEHGTLSGWDGRNLYFGNDGEFPAIDDNLDIVGFPPLDAVPSALGIVLFGNNEFGLRVFHALLGALCLPLLWLLLGFDFAGNRRLRVLAFVFFALSPIVILYVRQARYFADAMFFSLLVFYCYRRYMQDGQLRWAGGLGLATVLNFFNHYSIALSFSLALVVWHFLFFFKHTTRRQWIVLITAGAITSAICGGYLLATGIAVSDSLEYSEKFYNVPLVQRKLQLIYLYFHDIVYTGWLPVLVAAWWVAYLIWRAVQQAILWWQRRGKKLPEEAAEHNNTANTDSGVWRWVVMGVLLVVFSALSSVQPPDTHEIANMRYMVMALPFVLFLSARCVDWVMGLNRATGGFLLAFLLLTNFATSPYFFDSVYKLYQCKNSPFLLSALIKEVHSPYASATTEAVEFMRREGKQDETIFVPQGPDYVVLLYYLGKQLLFCCRLGDEANLPKEKITALGALVYKNQQSPPDYVVRFRDVSPKSGYQKIFQGKIFGYPTQRPSIELHCFYPVKRPNRSVAIYKKLPPPELLLEQPDNKPSP